jgi:hypothetical protein
MKQIMSTRGGYYLTYQDYSDPLQIEAGMFPIPTDCVAGALATVQLVQDSAIIPVCPIDPSEQFSTVAPSSLSYGYYCMGNVIQILPKPTVGVTRLWYTKRTSDLILVSQAAQVTLVNGPVISVSSLPSTILIGSTLDACGDQPPFNILATRQVADITGTDVTLDAQVDTLAPGDWLALSGQTPIPQIPVEFRLLLAWRVVELAWELQGYMEKAASAKKRRIEYIEDTFGLVTPRVQNDTKVINPIIGGFLSGNRNPRGRNFPAGRSS